MIYNLMRFSMHDGPGIRTTVFLKGCPLHCLWCHNPESQQRTPDLMHAESMCIGCDDCRRVCSQGGNAGRMPDKCSLCGECAAVCSTGARQLVGRQLSVDEVMRDVAKDVIFYDESGGGVTFSGGEPLMQPEFLTGLLQRCRARSIHTAVDTTGYAPWEILLAISPLTDLFLFDLKIMDDRRHRDFTGVSNERILDNLKALSQCHCAIRIRFPLIPGVNDDSDNVEKLGMFVAALPGVAHIDLLPYQRMGVDKYRRLGKEYLLPAVEPPVQESVDAVVRVLKKYRLDVKIGG